MHFSILTRTVTDYGEKLVFRPNDLGEFKVVKLSKRHWTERYECKNEVSYCRVLGRKVNSNRGINRGRRNENMALSPGMLLSP
jgi:hypothetical protein